MLRRAVNAPVTAAAMRRLVVLGNNRKKKPMMDSHRRLFNAAAATSREKRSLNQAQIKGEEKVGGAAGASTPPPSAGGGGATGGGGGSSPVPFIVGGLAVVGAGVAYSQGLVPGLSQHPEEKALEQAQEKQVEKSAEAAAPSSNSADGGNRVVQIQLPHGSQRSAPPPAGVTGHPIGGNRVAMHPVSAGSSSENNNSNGANAPTVDSALEELKNQLSQETSATLQEARKQLAQLSSMHVSELDNMTPTQLKIKLVQLAKDLEDRTKWEAVRLKEFLAMKEKEVEDKYIILMKKQRLEAESNMERKTKDLEYELTSQAQKAIQEKEQALQAIVDNSLKIQEHQFNEEKVGFEKRVEETISAKYEEMFGTTIAEAKQNFAQKMEQKVQQIQTLSKQLADLEFALQNTKTYQTGSVQAHRMSAAALSLIDKLESSKPAGAAMAALRAVADDNAVITSALEALPATAASSGIATLQELQTKFDEQVYKKCRQAALVPAGQQGLEGQLLGMVFSTLKFPPGPEDAAPESEKDAAEFVLARARRHIQLGELEPAVVQMDKLTGQTGFVAKDWTQKAKERVAVEKALKVIRLECALANESMSQGPKE